MRLFMNKDCLGGKNHIMVKYYKGEYRRYRKEEPGIQESRGDTYMEFAICKKCGMKVE